MFGRCGKGVRGAWGTACITTIRVAQELVIACLASGGHDR